MSASVLSLAASNVAAQLGWLSLHGANPGLSGAFEISMGTYERQAISWSSPNDGVIYNTAQIVVPLPSGATVNYFGLWSAQAGGVFGFGNTIAEQVTTGPTSYVIPVGSINLNVAASVVSLPGFVAYIPYLVGLDGGRSNTQGIVYANNSGWGIPSDGGKASTVSTVNYDGGNA